MSSIGLPKPTFSSVDEDGTAINLEWIFDGWRVSFIWDENEGACAIRTAKGDGQQFIEGKDSARKVAEWLTTQHKCEGQKP